MARTADAMAVYDETLASFVLRDPWDHRDGAQPVCQPNYYLLEDLLAVAVRAGARSESGVFPKGVDLWLSTELRRAGFGDEETWPRSTRPRVFPREIALLLDELPTRLRGYQGLDLRAEIQRRVNEIAAITPADAKILGRAYDKQVDVCVSRWERGPEILISTRPNSLHSARTCRTGSRRRTETLPTCAPDIRSPLLDSSLSSERRSSRKSQTLSNERRT